MNITCLRQIFFVFEDVEATKMINSLEFAFAYLGWNIITLLCGEFYLKQAPW